MTVTALDLARCTERGFPSLTGILFCDENSPFNRHDSKLVEDVEVAPATNPDKTFTEPSLARLCKDLQSLRHRVIILANDPRRHLSMSSSEV